MKRFFTPPNQLTFLRILLTPVFLAFLFSHELWYKQCSLAVFSVAALTDWYDGWIARRWGYVTRWGKFFDPFADKVITSGALIGFVYLNLVSAWMVWIIIVRDVLITFLRSYSEFKGRTFDTSKMAKSKTFLQFTVICYLLLLYVANETPGIQHAFNSSLQLLLHPTLIYLMMLVVTSITALSGILYIVDNWKTIRELYDFSGRVTQS